jgi:hypothetical protein
VTKQNPYVFAASGAIENALKIADRVIDQAFVPSKSCPSQSLLSLKRIVYCHKVTISSNISVSTLYLCCGAANQVLYGKR